MEKFCQCDLCGGESNFEKSKLKNSEKLDAFECEYCRTWNIALPEKTKMKTLDGKEIAAQKSRPATLDECIDIVTSKSPKKEKSELFEEVSKHSRALRSIKEDVYNSMSAKLEKNKTSAKTQDK